MIKSIMKKTPIREIRNSLGRYFAILAIVALGVDFLRAQSDESIDDQHS